MQRAVAALVLALPAYLLTNESFHPIEQRIEVSGRQANRTFHLGAAEPLLLEYELVVRGPADERLIVILRLNGATIATVPPVRLYAEQGGRAHIPVEAVRQGNNRLDARVAGSESATFELRARVHNYYGIAPDFPRVAVVGDDAVAHRTAGSSWGRRAARWAAFWVAGVLALLGVARILRAGAGRPGAYAVLLSPAVLLWALVAYSAATPLHLWLSLEALGVAVVVPVFLAAAVRWLVARPAAVVRFAAPAAVTLVLLEAALRVVNYVSPTFIFYSGSYSRYRGQPGAPFFDTHLNSRGFNDVEHEPSKPAGVTRRIVAIGDSVALGVVPYKANYLTLLETELSGDGTVEVINMGVAGTAPADYLAILVDEGLSFEPDVVIVNFFIGNDFEGNARQLYEYSYVATLARAVWRLRGDTGAVFSPPTAGDAVYIDEAPSLSENRFLEIEVQRAEIYRADAGDLADATVRAAGHLREMHDIARRRGADFVVVLIPDEVQVDADLQDQVARALRRTRDGLDFDQPNRVLAAALAKDGVRMLDLLPTFREQGTRTRLYKPRDTHWNLAGNRLAAEAIGRFLREEVLGHHAPGAR